MLSALILIGILIATIACTLRWGIGRTAAVVYVPAILFFNLTPPIRLPGLPNMSSGTAVGYGILFTLLFNSRELAKLRFNLLDFMVVILMIPPAVSSAANAGAWEAISRGGEQFFRWILPYMLGRIVFLEAKNRAVLLKVVCVCAIVLGLAATFEASGIRPLFVSRAMEQLNIAKTANNQVFWRFGLARSQTSLGHPIDLGVCGVLLGTFVLMLPRTVGLGWKSPLHLAAIICCGAMVVGSGSFTGFAAIALAIVLFALFHLRKIGPRLTMAAVVCEIVGIFGTMYWMLNTVLPERPQDNKAAESWWIRVKIIQEAWDLAKDSGFTGAGKNVDVRDVGTGSIDNAYLLFILQTGWLYLFLWVLLALTIGFIGYKAMRQTRITAERTPVAAALAGAMATLLAMATVYYGFVYSVLLPLLMGMIGSMYQLLEGRATPRSNVGPANVGSMPTGFRPVGGLR